MELILVPGLWLDASSWDAVLPGLQAAGHHARALTMPGTGAPAAESSSIGIADWVAATVEAIDDAVDGTGGPVALVGHSGGGNVVWGAADARPGQVSRVIFVDTVPPPPGAWISEFQVVDGVIPFPGWDFFPEAETSDIPGSDKERVAAAALSVPERVPHEPISLSDERRYQIPVTVLSGAMDAEQLRTELEQWGSFKDEAERIDSFEVVRLGSGHWPQFSMPGRLAEAIDEAVSGGSPVSNIETECPAGGLV
ncbi:MULTISPECIES: alpha/beta hydrolase [Arthrobacter]|uniref:Alpha/beta hydrolase n=2 Tax=Arthrobacter TaxID=1663 RepID=A0ABU9KLR8_9MICC|nr:alpha/beta hydrolase [Arthrobacter sp. YJM1]MDP5227297.1 alpha/beta hydrolase [Arthrobacter sp. YJM1]